MKKLPNTASSIEMLEAKLEAVETVDAMIKQVTELQDVLDCLQPLLKALSEVLYGEDDSPIALNKLVEDGVNYIQGVKH